MMMLENIYSALSVAFSPFSLLALCGGALLGVIIGALPGLGTIVALTICLPFTLYMDPGPAISLLLAVYCGSVYGGSISAVLINSPGTPQSAATNMDGYPLAKRGLAAQALGWVTASSVIGGLLSCVALVTATPQLAKLSISYGGPLEICSLIIMGLACIATLSEGNAVKGLMMGLVGLWLATIGSELSTGVIRFTFGFSGLESGLDMLPLVVGIFPLAEIFYRLYEEKSIGKPKPFHCNRIIFPTLKDWVGRKWLLFRSSLIGILIGILPGTGPTAATFISYASAKKTSPNRKNMGSGEPDGLIAAESANNAVTGGALVPLLALGIPGDASLALLMGTFLIHDITPGVRLMADNPHVVYGSFIILILANFVLVPASIVTVRIFNRLMNIPPAVFFGIITLLSMFGAYLGRNLLMDMGIALLAGIIGFGMRLWIWPAAALLIGYVLGPQFELRLGQVLLFKGDKSWIVYLAENPAGCILLAIALAILIWPFINGLREHFRPKNV